MAAADDTAPPSREEIERFERTRPAQWDRYSCDRPEPLWLLLALSLDCDPHWLQDVERNPRWRNHYWDLLEAKERRRQVLTEFAILRNPEFRALERRRVLYQSDDHSPYIRELDRRFPVPKRMTDAAARAVLVRADVKPETLHVSVPPNHDAPVRPDHGTPVPLKEKRTSWLDVEIEEARKRAAVPDDPHSVYAELMKLAEEGYRTLIGVSDDGDGIKYQTQTAVRFFTLKNLADRMRRARARERS
ncbi:hypothetical protein [Paraburkholderia sp. CNPSo 3281]|uniref:hypothetical protein n=1 Tax=Paraburkholderia sp. CNPSo 3281 TaxID=2940933 RepID=UPI0020B6745C|nr:hypothetical protein [Paraburkholderia sp. CNPSo 3281]MCP3713873.1 hypothetical protein [Paraburkholderia sp. CNPSo 3281]